VGGIVATNGVVSFDGGLYLSILTITNGWSGGAGTIYLANAGTLLSAGGVIATYGVMSVDFGSILVISNNWAGGFTLTNGALVVGGTLTTVANHNLNIGTNAIVSYPSAQLDTASTCDGTRTVPADQTVSYATSLTLCTNSVINLSSGSVLDVCTNGMADDVLNALLGAVSGEGTLNLNDCAPSTPP
jgi:hypothetical protein